MGFFFVFLKRFSKKSSKMVLNVPSVKLSDGKEMPQFGLGTWLSGKGEVRNAVEHAIKVGYRHIDTAFAYGNEAEVGEAIEAVIADGIVKREDLYIATKLWNTWHSAENVKKNCEKSLENLKIEQIDLYLMHFPMAWKGDENMVPLRDQTDPREVKRHLTEDIDYVDTWKAMEDLVRTGKVKSIGVSNFNSFQLQRILDNCTIKPVNNQLEVHPYLSNIELVDYCISKGLTVTAYSPLGNPSKPVTRKWTGEEITLLEEKIIVGLSKKYNKTPAQVYLV